MIAVDSSVLIDLLGDDVRAAGAEECVRQALARGPVVVCDVVVAEVVAGLGYGAELLDVLEDAGIRFSPSEARSAVRAGEMQRRYKARLRPKAARTARRARFPTSSSARTRCSSAAASSPGTRDSSATTSRD